MVLLFLDKHSELTQKEIAALIFKDNASMTRMINLMVNKKYLKRSMNPLDRRRYNIEITAKGKQVLESLPPIILSNREKSLEGITKEEIIQLESLLKKITSNCTKS
jgi:DNA-binding MarR family transcriptional regulator